MFRLTDFSTMRTPIRIFSILALCFLLVGCQRTAAPGMRAIHWGEPSQGIQCGVTAPSIVGKDYRQFTAVIAIRNVGRHPLRVISPQASLIECDSIQFQPTEITKPLALMVLPDDFSGSDMSHLFPPDLWATKSPIVTPGEVQDTHVPVEFITLAPGETRASKVTLANFWPDRKQPFIFYLQYHFRNPVRSPPRSDLWSGNAAAHVAVQVR